MHLSVSSEFLFMIYLPLLAIVDVVKDNLGKRAYDEDMVFPTLVFPSDHACLVVDLVQISDAAL